MKFAETLLEVRDALLPNPLTTDQLADFYIDELREARGKDFVKEFARELEEDAKAGRWFRRFFSGHPGVGKSTEFSRLEQRLGGKFWPIRINAQREVNPAHFHPLDLVLAMMKAVLEHTDRHVAKKKIPAQAAAALKAALEWMGETVTTVKTAKEGVVKTKTTVSSGSDSIIAKTLGVVAEVSGETRFAVGEETVHTPHRVKPAGEFLGHVNSVFAACDSVCRGEGQEASVGQFLLLVDNLEKRDFNQVAISKLFCEFSHILEELKIHYIITMPAERANSARVRQNDFYKCIRSTLDLPVFTRTFDRHDAGREALLKVLTNRMNPDLFADGQAERLVVACGGNVRDLFTMVIDARGEALNESETAERIEARHVTSAITERRTDYYNRLNDDQQSDEKPVAYKDKLTRLVEFYRSEALAARDEVFYDLLRARALQEFAANRVAVHPLVVDVLYEKGLFTELPPDQRRQDNRPLGATL